MHRDVPQVEVGPEFQAGICQTSRCDGRMGPIDETVVTLTTIRRCVGCGDGVGQTGIGEYRFKICDVYVPPCGYQNLAMVIVGYIYFQGSDSSVS